MNTGTTDGAKESSTSRLLPISQNVKGVTMQHRTPGNDRITVPLSAEALAEIIKKYPRPQLAAPDSKEWRAAMEKCQAELKARKTGNGGSHAKS